jgi:hypothetical protein
METLWAMHIYCLRFLRGIDLKSAEAAPHFDRVFFEVTPDLMNQRLDARSFLFANVNSGVLVIFFARPVLLHVADILTDPS